MPHRGASSFAEQTSPGSACPAWQKCQQKQHSFFACVYRFSTTTKQLSTVSANEEKKCLVKSGKATVTLQIMGFDAADHRFPRRNPSVSPQETDGFLRGNRWIPLHKPQVSSVNHSREVALPAGACAHDSCEKSMKIDAFYAWKAWNLSSITPSVTLSVTNPTRSAPAG